MEGTLPLVALVGRPNVGKSTLFNRLVGRRQAIVSEVAGTTRDRLERPIEWNSKQMRLSDMAGLEQAGSQSTDLHQAAQAQAERALQEAAVIIWVVDGRSGLTKDDIRIGDKLRKLGRPTIVAINKCDHLDHDELHVEFARYAFNGQVTLSALHGRGISELLDSVTPFVEGKVKLKETSELKVALIGRPNVGKSTLLNTLVADTRSVVSATAGTTRDSVDTVVPATTIFGNTYTRWQSVRMIDTAGIRQRGKIGRDIEHYSLLRTKNALEESDVAVFMIDAMEGMVHQDLQIAQLVQDSGRAVILAVNKWDLLLEKKQVILGTDEDLALQEHFLLHLRQSAPFLYWVQVLFMSATKQMNTTALTGLLIKAYNSWSLEVSQESLNLIAEELRRLPRLKNLQKITYEHSQPPVFHLHVEGKSLPHFSTIRYVDNELRDYLKIGATPIKVWAVPSVPKHIPFTKQNKGIR